jgi:hypothetical protein
VCGAAAGRAVSKSIKVGPCSSNDLSASASNLPSHPCLLSLMLDTKIRGICSSWCCRSCCEEVHQYNSKLMAAVTLMLQHASDMKKAVRDTQASVNQAAGEIAAAPLPIPSI